MGLMIAFIDFTKANGTINRDRVWERVFKKDVRDKVLQAVQPFYRNVSSCDRVNGIGYTPTGSKCKLVSVKDVCYLSCFSVCT